MLARFLALCFFLSPALVSAQMQPPGPMPPMPPPSGMPQPDFAAMKAMHDQMEAIHKNEREQVLAALTPAHRTLVATLVGGMAVAANPDPKAAAAKLDAALGASEKSAITSAHESAKTQMHQLMEKQMQQMRQMHPDGGPPQIRQFPGGPQERRTPPTAGEIVLRTLGPEPEMHDMMYFNRAGMSGRRPAPPNVMPPSTAPNPSST